MATKRLKELLESRKASSRDNSSWEIYFTMRLCILLRHNLLINFVVYAGAGGNGPGIQVMIKFKYTEGILVACFMYLYLRNSSLLHVLLSTNTTTLYVKSLMQAIEHELEVTVRVHEVRLEYERQMEE